MKKLICALAILLVTLVTQAQENYSITGTVSDSKGVTLPGATVFLTNTKHIAATNGQGVFTINGLAAGTYELVIKMIGFEPFVQKIVLNQRVFNVNAQLKEDNVLMNEVAITVADPNRAKYIQLFTKYFIGESVNSGQCKIIDPEVLKFRYDKDTKVLEAHTDKLLIIENRGLGYRLNYLLTAFKFDQNSLTLSYNGYPYFEELEGTAPRQKRWAKNRENAYLGSMSHFFKSAFNHTTTSEGFLIYALTDKEARTGLAQMQPTPADSLFTPLGDTFKLLKPQYDLHTAADTTILFVLYKGSKEPYNFFKSGLAVQAPFRLNADGQLSTIEPLTSNIQIDKNGRVNKPQGLLVQGYWAWAKIAELMPIEYGTAKSGNGPQNILNSRQEPNMPSKLQQTLVRLNKHTANWPTEHIYLHINKPWYKRADTLWFKLYTVTNGHKPSDISEVAYVDLIGQKDSILQHLKLKLLNGTASGDFALPLELQPGPYHIRAYTNWMKNSGAESFYERPITIGNPMPVQVAASASSQKNKVKPVIAKANSSASQPDVQFFPEGGDLVDGILSRVAFKAVNTDGTPVELKGNIVANDGQTVATLVTAHAGMGAFDLVPQFGKAYKASITTVNGDVQTVPLPAVLSKGFTLAINNNDHDSLSVTIKHNYGGKSPIPFYIIVQSSGKVYDTRNGTINGPSGTLSIAKSRLPTGINRVTLFSGMGEPLCERVVFIQQPDELTLALYPGKNALAANEGTTLDLTAGYASQPANGNFSVAVINEDKVPVDENSEPTIFSQLLLSAELHGAIADPGYYLSGQDAKKQADLDLLLLTQGYRKLKWQQLIDTTKKPQSMAEVGLNISGWVTNANGKPAAKSKVMVIFPVLHLSVDTLTDADGRFNITGLDIPGKTRVIVKALSATNSNKLNIKLDEPTAPSISISAINTAQPPSAALAKSYQDEEQEYLRLNGRQLNEVKIKANYDPQKGKPDLSSSANLNGPGHADQVVMGKDLEGCPILSTCLIGKVAGITVKSDGKVIDMSRGVKMDFSHRQLDGSVAVIPMSISLDGVPISQLDDINPNDIYSIEILTSVKYKSIYGHDAAGGLILITTKRGIPKNEQLPQTREPNGILSYAFNGFYKARSFYSPKYDLAKGADQIQPPAIYWNADIATDKDGKYALQYSNAGKGTYRVVVEGMDGEGRLGRVVYRYKVE